MRKRLTALALALLLLFAAAVPAAAQTQQENTADALHELGLFLGMGNGDYALQESLTRAQGITLLVRMIGAKAQAETGTFTTPFTDVPQWAAGYVGYAYTNGLTKGVADNAFGSEQKLSDCMFLTMVLRALGYSDSGANARFVWNSPYALAKSVGLIETAAADASFTRGDAVEVFWNALQAVPVGKTETLAQSLMARGVFTAEALEKAEKIYAGQGTIEAPEGNFGDHGSKPEQDDDTDSGNEDTPQKPQTPPQQGDGPDVGVGGLPIV